MQNDNHIIILLSSAVLAALVTSLTNLIISLINNHKLKVIEKQKKDIEIYKYRYSHLYDILLKWYEYSTSIEDKYSIDARIISEFLDNCGRYNLMRPLLDEQFIDSLDEKRDKGQNLCNKLVSIHKKDGFSEEYQHIKEECISNAFKFRDELSRTIHEQLRLLLKNN